MKNQWGCTCWGRRRRPAPPQSSATTCCRKQGFQGSLPGTGSPSPEHRQISPLQTQHRARRLTPQTPGSGRSDPRPGTADDRFQNIMKQSTSSASPATRGPNKSSYPSQLVYWGDFVILFGIAGNRCQHRCPFVGKHFWGCFLKLVGYDLNKWDGTGHFHISTSPESGFLSRNSRYTGIF